MKKRMIMFALLLMAMVSVQAQSLLGTWKLSDVDGMKFYQTFSPGQKTTIKIVQDKINDEMGVIEMTVTIPGTYIMKGKTITMNMNTQATDAKFSKMQFNSETEKMFKEMPEMKKHFVDEMQKALEETKKGLKEDLPLGGDMEILSLTNTTLKLNVGGDVMTFTKTK